MTDLIEAFVNLFFFSSTQKYAYESLVRLFYENLQSFLVGELETLVMRKEILLIVLYLMLFMI